MISYRVLMTPWVATPRSSRWLVLLVLVLLAVGAALGNVFGHPQRAWVLSAGMLAIGNAVFWLLLMPNGLLLALAARRLRLPGISRDVAWSLPLYAALWIGVPMLCQFPHGHMLGFAVMQVLVTTGAMLFVVMPGYLALTLYVVFLFSHRALSHVISIPTPFDPRFVPWGGTFAAVLVLILASRWRQLLRGHYVERGLSAPTVIRLRRNPDSAQSDPLTDAGSMRTRPGWLLARPDLRGIGPQAPGRSLRMALGGVYLPQTIIGRLYQLIPVVLLLGTMAVIFFVSTLGRLDVSRLLHYVYSRDGFRAVSWMFPVFGLMIVIMPVELLTLRWGRPNAELPLLALLPRLDGAQRIMLCTVIGRPAIRLGLLLVVGLAGAAVLDVGWLVVLAMLVVALGCLGYLVAMALSILGGLSLHAFGRSLLMVILFVFFTLTVLLPQLRGMLAASAVAAARDALVAVWLALACWLLWVGHRGWRGLQQRPHPFLLN